MVNVRLRRAGLPAVITAAVAAIAVTGTVWLGGSADADTTTPDPAGNAVKAAADTAAKVTASRNASARGLRAASATDELAFGDLTGDGKADLAAIDAAGTLWVYPGRGYVYSGTGTRSKSLFAARFKVGTGWGRFTSLVRHGDFNGDGKQDVLTRDAQGRLFFYAGTGKASGIVKSGTQAGTGWNSFVSITGAGDLNSDGKDDLLAQQSTGDLMLYTGTNNPARPFSAHGTKVGTGWKGDLLTAVGDWSGDGRPEFMFRNTKGIVYGYDSKPGLNPIGARHTVIDDPATGRYLTNMVGMGDLTSDADLQPAVPDVLWQGSDGALILVAPDVATDDVQIGSGWARYRLF